MLIIQYLHFDPNYSYLYLGNCCEREEEYKYLRQLKFPTNSLANTCILMCVGLYKFAGSDMQVIHTLEENTNVSLYNYLITGHITLHREPKYLRSLELYAHVNQIKIACTVMLLLLQTGRPIYITVG